MSLADFTLTRQFLGNLCGRGILDEEGIEGLQRVLISALAGVVSLGLYLPRRFFKKYILLSALSTPDLYRQELVADELFIIGLCMTIAGLTAALVAPAIFPNETDYLTLTPLPLKRSRIFGAKLLALATFTGAFVVTVSVLFSVTFPLFTEGRWAEQGRLLRIVSLMLASGLASVFAFVFVAALQGVTLLTAPQRWAGQASTLLQSLLVAAVLLLAPVSVRLSSQSAWLGTHPPALAWFAPAWFLGLEHVLLGSGEGYFASLARIGGLVSLGAVGVSALCYSTFYWKFEHVMLAPTGSREPALKGLRSWLAHRRASSWSSAAVWTFIALTLRRNRLSQLLVVMTWSAGCALALYGLLNSLFGVSFRSGEAFPQPFLDASITLPFVLILFGVVGLRGAFLLPVNSRANWIFRLTDDPARRRGHLNAVDGVFGVFAILPALAIAAAIQLYALSVSVAVMALLLAGAWGALVVEGVLFNWRRIPFTCTWLPGKRPFPVTLIAISLTLWLFLFVANLMTFALFHPSRFLVLFGALAAAAAWARRRRLRTWASKPIEFEDEPFDSFQRLDLSQS